MVPGLQRRWLPSRSVCLAQNPLDPSPILTAPPSSPGDQRPSPGSGLLPLLLSLLQILTDNTCIRLPKALLIKSLNILHENGLSEDRYKNMISRIYDYPVPELFDMQLKCYCSTYWLWLMANVCTVLNYLKHFKYFRLKVKLVDFYLQKPSLIWTQVLSVVLTIDCKYKK